MVAGLPVEQGCGAMKGYRLGREWMYTISKTTITARRRRRERCGGAGGRKPSSAVVTPRVFEWCDGEGWGKRLWRTRRRPVDRYPSERTAVRAFTTSRQPPPTAHYNRGIIIYRRLPPSTAYTINEKYARAPLPQPRQAVRADVTTSMDDVLSHFVPAPQHKTTTTTDDSRMIFNTLCYNLNKYLNNLA